MPEAEKIPPVKELKTPHRISRPEAISLTVVSPIDARVKTARDSPWEDPVNPDPVKNLPFFDDTTSKQRLHSLQLWALLPPCLFGRGDHVFLSKIKNQAEFFARGIIYSEFGKHMPDRPLFARACHKGEEK
jgi:hypothetical protein